MKFITVIIVIFLIAACGQTNAKKKSSTSSTNGKIKISASSTLAYCPVNYVVSYDSIDQMITQLKVKGCLGSGVGCSIDDYRNARQRIENFKVLYQYQATCKNTDGENIWELHSNDFDDEYTQIMSILNAE